jgi:hypothetical protein
LPDKTTPALKRGGCLLRHLFVDGDDNAAADGATAFADGEAEALLNGKWV